MLFGIHSWLNKVKKSYTKLFKILNKKNAPSKRKK